MYYKLLDINLIEEKERERVLNTVYEYIPETYKKYFEKYGKNRWPYNKFLTKVKNEYPLGILGEENEKLLFYFAFSKPQDIEGMEYFK